MITRSLTLSTIILLISASHALGTGIKTTACLDFFSARTRSTELRTPFDPATLIQRSTNEYRKQLVQTNLLKEVTTEADRTEFMKILPEKDQPNRIAIEFENSMLKFVNDVLQDKDAATALDNMANEEVLNKITKWTNENHPGSKIYKYSDGKSLSVVIDTTRPLRSKDRLVIDKEFTVFQNELGSLLRSKKLFRESDKVEDWFRMGTGGTSDEAYFAARVSRKLAGPNKVIHFSHPAVRKKLPDMLYHAEYFRVQIARIAKLEFLLKSDVITKKLIPNLKLFEILRKSRSVDELTKKLAERFQLQLETNEVDWLFNYAEIIDLLNPKFFVVDQTVVTLAKAVNGGIVVDRKGMGAANQQAAATAAVQSTHNVLGNLSLIEVNQEQVPFLTKDVVTEFIKNNRTQEALVTKEIVRYRKYMETR